MNIVNKNFNLITIKNSHVITTFLLNFALNGRFKLLQKREKTNNFRIKWKMCIL